jgi:ABC-2 type transport system permease protein
MSALAVLGEVRAERIKLSSTRSPVWTAAAVAMLSMGIAALQAANASETSRLEPERVAIGVAVFGVPLLMIVASLTVTGEYRTGLIRTTFMATPNRTLVLITKAVVGSVFSGIYTAVMVLLSMLVARAVAKPLVGADLSLADPGTWRVVGAIALYAMLAAVLGVGVGALARFSAGAVALLLVWPLVVEPLLGALPSIGSEVGPYLPFVNAFLFTRVPWLYPSYSMPWGEFGSLVYFAVVVGVVFTAAVIDINRRDPR